MAVTHASIGLMGLTFISGSLVLLWFVILSGVVNTAPLDSTYFLRASTNGISGARSVTQWTYFYICGDGNTDCGPAVADLPIGYAWSGNPRNAPAELVGDFGGGTTSFSYWYMWRFGWVFYILALFFEVLAFFTSFLACCGRLGSAVSGLVSMLALVVYTAGVSLMTATFVKMRDAFRADGREAEIGQYAFGFSWGAWVALFIATMLFCMGTRGDGSSRGWGRARRRRSTRSRQSFDVNGRRVKEEYP
ncbi:hypothetical protein GQ53DRAFT_769877 [Thozetella sp. PMI_491]|nr:hypothetical protein GQ53DRAFT_769877 [Thozetella sp. PMI_491]